MSGVLADAFSLISADGNGQSLRQMYRSARIASIAAEEDAPIVKSKEKTSCRWDEMG